MGNEMFRMFELHRQGFNCSQILLELGLEARGAKNPELIRAVSGLGGGLGFGGKICGALTGGVCLLGLYAGRGAPEEEEHDRFLLMISELVDWFEAETGSVYGGIDCLDIIGDELAAKTIDPKCGDIVSATYDKVKEILEANKINMTGEKLA